MTELRIVFMGTPEFAVPSLEILVENNFNVVTVITAPDKPQGRGQKLMPSPVKACAVGLGIPVLQPTNLKDAEFQTALRNLNANLQVVVAFRMLPEAVWSMPLLGTFNLHASLLPQYRGAAPINWAIINGETETGVTTFFLQHEIDTGRIIFQEKEPILDDDNVGSLYERLKVKGSQVVLRTVQAIAEGTAPSIPQITPSTLRSAPKIFKETCELHWTETAVQVRNKVRGLSPYPAAWCTLNEKIFKILSASISDSTKSGNPGDIDTDGKTYVRICTTQGWITIDELQPEGKRKMKIREFFAGNKL
jgi:methionyl-tRNA formyltransferase